MQIGTDLVESQGGIFQASVDFHRALGGRTLSFTAHGLVPPGQGGHVQHISVGPSFLSRGYSRPERSDALSAATQMLAEADVIVIHGLFRYHVQWAAATALALRIPYWIVPHGALDAWVFSYRSLRKRVWMKVVADRYLSRPSALIFATARERDKALAYLPSASRTWVLHWPAEAPNDEARPAARLRVRQRLGVPTDCLLLLYLGRVHPMKRIMEMVETHVSAGVPHVHLVIVGPDTPALPLDAVRTLAAELRGTNVHVVGPAFGAAKHEWMLAADGFISLSKRENFNYGAAEALAAGLPVILSPGNALAPELRDAGVGWLLGTETQNEAVRALREFSISSREELASLRANAAEWARRELSRDRFEAALRSLREATAGVATVRSRGAG